MNMNGERPRPIRVLISDISPLVSSGIDAALAMSAAFESRRCSLKRVLEGELDAAPAFDVVVAGAEPGLRMMSEQTRPLLPAAIRQANLFVFNLGSGEREIRDAFEAGIHGYATLELSLEDFQEGIKSVARGMRFVCPKSAQQLAASMGRERLTPRETAVLVQLARGLSNKTIAQVLQIALGTVKTHVKTLMAKLGAKTRTQVVTIAIARGLVDPPINPDVMDTKRHIGSAVLVRGLNALSLAS